MEKLIPAAQYLRMSTDHQRYSIDNQARAISVYAAERGFEIVRTYTDSGKSGLVLKHREGLGRLLKDVVGGPKRYRAILVYDISRWGRFQDTDEAAYYEFMCKQAGITVHYCAEPFANDGTTPSVVMKALKRVMAAEYSRELSNKVFEGQRAMVLRGRWMGSQPGFGLRRLLVDAEGHPKQQLNMFERKNLKSDQIIIVPGPQEEVNAVREIFDMFVTKRMSTGAIADELNRRKIMHAGKAWNYQAVLKIISHEKYTGSLVWGRMTQKLRTRCVPVPRQQWTVVPGVIEPIVNRKIFDRAQRILRNRMENQSDEEVLNRVLTLFRRKGRISSQLLNASRSTPSSTCCRDRFGSLTNMYRLLDYANDDSASVREQTRRMLTLLCRKLFARLRKALGTKISIFRSIAGRPTLLKFDSGLKMSLAICPCVRTSRGAMRWTFQSTFAKRMGWVTLLCRCNSDNTGVHDLFVLPSLSNMPRLALLTQKDKRLERGRRVNRPTEILKLAHRFPNSQAETLRLEGWSEISQHLGAAKSTIKRWAGWGMPVASRGHYVTASKDELDAWLRTARLNTKSKSRFRQRLMPHE